MNKKILESLEERRSSLSDLREYKKYSMILGSYLLEIPPSKMARFFDYSLSSFRRIEKELADSINSTKTKPSWGGRRKSYFTEMQEAHITRTLGELSRSGGFVDIAQIRELLEKEAGRSLHKTTIYRFLERHEFRKNSPRKYHPKRNLEIQETFKKTSLS